jgi:predicted alpha/beta hydrolase
MATSGIRRDTLPVRLADADVTLSLFVPANSRATVLCLPALGVPASYYEPLAAALAGRGLAVATADLRGIGTSSVRPSRSVDFGYARLVDDTGIVVSAVRQRFGRPVVLLGHSLGGHVGTMLAGSDATALDGLTLAACGTPYWRRFPARMGLGVLGLAGLAKALGRLLGYFPGSRVGFGGTEAAQLMGEWARLARTGRFDVAGLDAEAALARVRTRTLVVSIEGDTMAPPGAVAHLVEKLAGAPVERIHVTRAMAGRPLDHFRWVRSPDAVADIVARWVPVRSEQEVP